MSCTALRRGIPSGGTKAPYGVSCCACCGESAVGASQSTHREELMMGSQECLALQEISFQTTAAFRLALQ